MELGPGADVLSREASKSFVKIQKQACRLIESRIRIKVKMKNVGINLTSDACSTTSTTPANAATAATPWQAPV